MAPKTIVTKEKTTESNDVLNSISNLSLAEKAKLLAMLRIDREVATQADATIEAEVNQLKAKNEELRAQIKPLNDEIHSNVLRINQLTGRNTASNGERKTRENRTCQECGQGRHADNAKTRSCNTYRLQQAGKPEVVAHSSNWILHRYASSPIGVTSGGVNEILFLNPI